MEHPSAAPEPEQVIVRDEMWELVQQGRALQAEEQPAPGASQHSVVLPSGHVWLPGSPMRTDEAALAELVRQGRRPVVPAAPVRLPFAPHRHGDLD
ncbi:hypothetical protein ABT224_36325 [Streptomyces sp. NPDC001584]|uniref:hypothetical protein n=1 Tax=Streptomyces sp. NPDC001584 TaxID=3154521 RepID=UPI0033178AA1